NNETRQAAVAVVLHESDDGSEILFIKRAQHDADPWSGHMAFPGGHRDPVDVSLQAAAVRETREEIGLDLDGATFLGSLSQQRA
ncbi:MAG TPA: CoA pyrophosphatase, partial [Gammaproteobacteria bacterium]|nr:CoA pyrophosphatase [Gammaproteobacteria bacterium]